MIEGGAQRTMLLKIIIQEEGCGQPVKDCQTFPLDRYHSRKTLSRGHVAMVKISAQ